MDDDLLVKFDIGFQYPVAIFFHEPAGARFPIRHLVYEMMAQCVQQQVIRATFYVTLQVHQIGAFASCHQPIHNVVQHFPAKRRKRVCTRFRWNQGGNPTGKFGSAIPVAHRVDGRGLLRVGRMKIYETLRASHCSTYLPGIFRQGMIPFRVDDDDGFATHDRLTNQ